MALEDLGTQEDFGLAQNPLSPYGDPLAFAKSVPAPEVAPGIRVPGAQMGNILMPKGVGYEVTGQPIKRASEAPNPLSPLVQQQGQPQNGLFGELNSLLQARALQASQQPAPPSAPSSALPQGTPYSPDITQKIAAAATKYGIDPNVANAVFRSEGASGYIGDEGSSFGPFQLHMGGLSKKFPYPGLGDQFMKETRLDPRDPKTQDAQIDFALRHASQNGWGAWGGSRDSAGRFLGLPTEGISPFYGIKGGAVETSAPKGPLAGTSAPVGPFGASQQGQNELQQRLWHMMLLRTLFPQFHFQNISYDPWAIHQFAVHGGY